MAGRHARPTRAQARAGAYALQPQPVSARVVQSKRGRLAKRTRGAAAGSAALAGAVTLGLLAGGGTLALWNQTATVDAGTVESGSAAIAVDSQALLPVENLLPGESVGQVIDLANTGTIALAVAARIDAADPAFELRLSIGYEDCGAVPIGGAPLRTTATSLDTVASFTTVDLCVEVTATSLVTPDDEFEFDFALDGTQAP